MLNSAFAGTGNDIRMSPKSAAGCMPWFAAARVETSALGQLRRQGRETRDPFPAWIEIAVARSTGEILHRRRHMAAAAGPAVGSERGEKGTRLINLGLAEVSRCRWGREMFPGT